MDNHPESCHVDKEKLNIPTCPEWKKREQFNERRLKELSDSESFIMGEIEKMQGRLVEIRQEATVLRAGQEAGRLAMQDYAKYLQEPKSEELPKEPPVGKNTTPAQGKQKAD